MLWQITATSNVRLFLCYLGKGMAFASMATLFLYSFSGWATTGDARILSGMLASGRSLAITVNDGNVTVNDTAAVHSPVIGNVFGPAGTCRDGCHRSVDTTTL